MINDQSISLGALVIDPKYQTRVQMNQEAIVAYADAIMQAECWPFPPIQIVNQVVVDGFHRIAAAKQVINAPGTPTELRKALLAIPCKRVEVDPGIKDISDLALRSALAANQKHGLRPSNADKKRAVNLALNSWPDKSDREIAKLTGCSHTFVSNFRGELALATLPPDSEPEAVLDNPGKLATLPPTLQEVPAQKDPGVVATLPPQSKQQPPGGSDEQKPNPEELAKKVRSIAHQYRDKLVVAIDDYAQHKPNRKEQDRLVRLVQGVSLW
jgi:hypothetical protein